VALLLQPARDRALGDRLAQLGHGHRGRLAVPRGPGRGRLGRPLPRLGRGLLLGSLLLLATALGRRLLALLLAAGLLAALLGLGGLLGPLLHRPRLLRA